MCFWYGQYFARTKTKIFVDRDYEVKAIKEHFGNAPAVKVENGEYTEVYCMEGKTPYLDKDLCKIWIEVED